MSWWESLTVSDFRQVVFSVRGVDIVSDVVAVTPGRQEDGAEFVAVRVRSSRGDQLVENVATAYVRSDRTLEQFQESIRQSREWFADQFAQELLGIAPPKPVFWLVSASNPNDPSKRVQGAAVCDPASPRTLLSQDFCVALGLKIIKGNCQVLLRVLGKRFLIEAASANIPILAVIGSDLIERAIAEDADRSHLLESFFLDPTARAYAARRKSRAKTVLVIGSYGDEGIKQLRSIEGRLFNLGYDPVLIVDYPSEGESWESKMLSFATISRFVVYEATFASGAIDELAICKNNELITAVLHERGRMATAMQAHYPLEHAFIKFFPYQADSLESSLKTATEWAETIVASREKAYKPQR